MKSSSEKRHLIITRAEATTLMIDGLPIVSSKTEVLLGIKINQEFKFDDHDNYLCKKAGQKPNSIAGIGRFMNVSKRPIIMK